MKSLLATLRYGLMLTAIVTATVMSGCKDSATSPEVTVTEDDAADAVAASFGESSGGFTAQMSDVGTLAKGGSLTGTIGKGDGAHLLRDTTIVRSKTNTILGKIYTWNYTFKFGYKYVLSDTSEQDTYNPLLKGLKFGYSMHGTYDTPRISSNDSATAVWTVTGISPQAAYYVLNGTYYRGGSQTGKVRGRTFSSTINVTLNNLHIDPTSPHTVQSGTATIAFAGSSSTGKSFSHSGTLTFNGNKMATLVTQSGKTYLINLATGEVSAG